MTATVHNPDHHMQSLRSIIARRCWLGMMPVMVSPANWRHVTLREWQRKGGAATGMARRRGKLAKNAHPSLTRLDSHLPVGKMA